MKLTPNSDLPPALQVESAVRDRYSQAAQARVDALCCPIDYDQRYLKPIPREILDRDYGCGDPSRHLRPGETVLDLGSGAGKICFIASQVVGPAGRVIGVDMNDDMLALARRHQHQFGDAIGHHNIEFRKGRIQDLALDLERLDDALKARAIDGADAFLAAETLAEELRVRHPLVAADTVDVVVSNCVLNLVDPRAKSRLFGEIFRVLKTGGRAVISDIVSDEEVPGEMQNDPELWSGCIAGALTEEGFLQAFADAGFHGIRILKLDPTPWRAVQGIEFRSMTVEAFKGRPGDCFERNQAVIYKGPFKEVIDDELHRMERGRRYAVCDKTYQLFQKPPYREFFEFIESRHQLPVEQAPPFNVEGLRRRQPRETKGENYRATSDTSRCCDGGDCC
jgi:ubiquinone/menaquinone biosynthesis C-methylase UbiE